MIVSARGIQLVVSTAERPLLTVELYTKWYTLWLINENDHAEAVIFPEAEGYETHHIDHVPSPEVVLRYAESKNLTIDELAWELILGRWCNLDDVRIIAW
jgi:hypothetical protein